MKTIIIAFAALFPALAMADHHKEAPSAKKEAAALFRHVVCFKFKKEAKPKQIKNIVDLEWGTNVSPEDRAKGFTHCFIVTFKNRAGLDVYLPHPEHQAFVKILKPILDDVFVFDFIGK